MFKLKKIKIGFYSATVYYQLSSIKCFSTLLFIIDSRWSVPWVVEVTALAACAMCNVIGRCILWMCACTAAAQPPCVCGLSRRPPPRRAPRPPRRASRTPHANLFPLYFAPHSRLHFALCSPFFHFTTQLLFKLLLIFSYRYEII